jgi:S-(hydroxymethyl)glutathione dehydrogenase/alcohol dehydrogenase
MSAPTIQARAAVLSQIGCPLELVDLEIPELKPGQVLVDIAWSGVCHSQLNEVEGLRGPDPYIPHALGHEGSGIVRSIGGDVAKVRQGDRVVLTWIKGTGADVPGTVYGSKLGAINSGAVSTFMTRAVVSENRIVRIPDDFPLREAALLGCAVPTGAGIVFNTLSPKSGQSIAVFGIGGVGVSAVMAAAMLGAGPIIAVDLNDDRLAIARRFGATHLINAVREDVLAAIREATGGQGVDFSIEAAGRSQTMENAFAAVRGAGGLCVVAGNPPHGTKVSIDPYDLIRGKRLAGSWGGDSRPDRDIPVYAGLYRDGKMPLDLFSGREYGLDAINAALDDLRTGRVLRPLINMSS